ncbi:MAG: hypothetical protein WC869_00010 [Phycisphaerae bacterium]|jgi:hypothetical protein
MARNSTKPYTICVCARCGGKHTEIYYHKLKNPIGKFTHWAPCPKTYEPILMRYTGKDLKK